VVVQRALTWEQPLKAVGCSLTLLLTATHMHLVTKACAEVAAQTFCVCMHNSGASLLVPGPVLLVPSP
jgi:hypothetical protein